MDLKVGDLVLVRTAYVDRQLVGKTVKITEIKGDHVFLEGATASWSLSMLDEEKDLVRVDEPINVKFKLPSGL